MSTQGSIGNILKAKIKALGDEKKIYEKSIIVITLPSLLV